MPGTAWRDRSKSTRVSSSTSFYCNKVFTTFIPCLWSSSQKFWRISHLELKLLCWNHCSYSLMLPTNTWSAGLEMSMLTITPLKRLGNHCVYRWTTTMTTTYPYHNTTVKFLRWYKNISWQSWSWNSKECKNYVNGHT